MGRFFDDVEKAYMRQFDEQDVLDFRHIDDIEAYHALLKKAIKRNAAVTVEEIKAYFGEDAYDEQMKYLSQWE